MLAEGRRGFPLSLSFIPCIAFNNDLSIMKPHSPALLKLALRAGLSAAVPAALAISFSWSRVHAEDSSDGLTSITTTITDENSIGCGVTYSGFVLNIVSSPDNFSAASFALYHADGTSGTACAGTDYITSEGFLANDAAADSSAPLWHYYTNNFSDSTYGNSLRVSLSGDMTVKVDFNVFSAGGLIVERGDCSLTLVNSSSKSSRNYYFEGNGDVNLTIGADTTLRDSFSGSAVCFASGGAWAVAGGKTLTFDVERVSLSSGIQVVISNADGDAAAADGAVAIEGELELASQSGVTVGEDMTLTLDVKSSESSNILIALSPSASLINLGTILADAEGTGASAAAYIHGMHLDGAAMENAGTVKITETSSAGMVHGISLAGSGSGGGAVLANCGAIAVDVSTSGSYAYGIVMSGYSGLTNAEGGSIAISSAASGGTATALQLSSYSTLVNDGAITMEASGAVIFGISIAASTVYNSGSMTISAEGTGAVYALYSASKGDMTNNGTMEITAASSGGSVRGIYYGAGTLENNGSLAVAAASAASDACGVYLFNSGSVFTNAGDLVVSSSSDAGTAYGLYICNSASMVSSGALTVESGGANVYGIYLKQKASSLYNSGVLTTDSIFLATDTNTVLLCGGTVLRAAAEGGTMSISGAGVLYLGGSLDTESAAAASSQASTVTAASDVVIYSMSVTLLDGVSVETSGSGANITFKDVSITVEDGGTASLTRAVISGESSVSAPTAGTLGLTEVTLVLDSANSSAVSENDATAYTITTDLLSRVSVSGTFTLDLTSYGISVASYDAVYVSFGSGTVFQDDAVILAAGADGVTYEACSTLGNVVVFSASVPEPAAAALGILALAAMAARRRRVP